jgi:hypothetical protein
MTRNTKILLGVLAGLLALCLIACVAAVLIFGVAGSRISQSVTDSVQEDPAAVQADAGAIADFELPPGYTAVSSASMLDIRFVVWEHETQPATLILLQMPLSAPIDDVTIDQMENAIRRRAPRELNNLRTVERRELTLRGEPARFILMEGEEAESGERFEQALIAFQGKGGMALLMVLAPAGQAQPAAEVLIRSLR